MKVLYSTQSVVEYDGHHYYSNPVQATYKRYMTLGKDITVFCHQKIVNKPKSDLVDDGDLHFVFAKKVNTVRAIIRREDKQNDNVAEELVKMADVCVCHVPCAHSYQVIKYANKYKKPYLTVVCGCPWDALWNFDWRGKLLAPMAYFTLKRIMKDTPFSIYVTNEFLQRRYPTKGKSIGCSNVNISTGVNGVLEQRLTNIKKRNIEGRMLRIGTAAAIDVPYKGQEYVIRALSKLKSQGKMFEYHLIGLGSNERLKKIAIEEGVEDQVLFHGSLPHSKVIDFMDDIDIYVQPSKQEGLPRSLIEAMSRGCFCLGSRTAGIPELLDSNYVFPKGDVSRITKILNNVSIDSLNEQARINFEGAKQYDRVVLNQRRSVFIEEFKNSFLKRENQK